MNIQKIKKNVPGTIAVFAVPSIIAMILTSLISVVDGFFIGNYLGDEGIAAINLGLPLLLIFFAIGIMIGVGGSSIATRLLGSGKHEESGKVFNQTMLTGLFSLVFVSLMLFLFWDAISGVYNVSIDVKNYLSKYYLIMIWVYPLMVANANGGMFIRSEGKPQLFMLFTILTVILNIILDYVFIAKLGFGIEGIAYASLIAVIVGLLCTLYYFIFRSKIFNFRTFVFSKNVLFETVINGSSELIGQLSMSITTLAFNFVIIGIAGTEGVAAFAIAGYVSYIFSMIIIGLGQGASPLISFAFGAGDIQLGKKVRRLSNIYAVVIGIVTFAALFFLADWYAVLFVKNQIVRELVNNGLWVFALAFIVAGANILSSFYFTSIGKAAESALISSLRGLILLLLGILILPTLFGMTGVWLVAPVTEILTLVVTSILLMRHDSLQAHHLSKNPV